MVERVAAAAEQFDVAHFHIGGLHLPVISCCRRAWDSM